MRGGGEGGLRALRACCVDGVRWLRARLRRSRCGGSSIPNPPSYDVRTDQLVFDGSVGNKVVSEAHMRQPLRMPLRLDGARNEEYQCLVFV